MARGGIIPAVMIQAVWGGGLEWLWLHFRGDDQVPVRPHPQLIWPMTFDPRGRRILLVNGVADHVLFNEDGFNFPWRMDIE